MRRNTCWIAIALFITALLLYTFSLSRESLSIDETTSYLVSRDWGSLVDTFLNKDRNMWLYYLILYPFLQLGGTEFWIRLPSALVGAAGVAAMFYAGRQLAGTRVGIIAALLLLGNAFYLLHAQDARSYPLFATLTIAAGLAFVHYWRAPDSRSLWLLTGVNLLGLYAHVFAFFVFLTQLTWIAFRAARTASRSSRRVFARHLITSITGYIIGMMPLVITLLVSSREEIAAGTKRVLDWISPPELIDLPDLYFRFFYGSPLITLLSGVAIGTAIIALVRAGARGSKSAAGSSEKEQPLRLFSSPDCRAALWYHFSIFFITIPVLFLFSLWVKPVFVDRYYIYALPSGIILIAAGLARYRRAVGYMAVTVYLFAQANTIRLYFTTIHKPPLREAAVWLMQSAKGTDQVLFYPDQLEKTFRYYEERMPPKTAVSYRPPLSVISINTDDKTTMLREYLDNRARRAAGVDNADASGSLWLYTRDDLSEARKKKLAEIVDALNAAAAASEKKVFREIRLVKYDF